jgi:predicted DNA-binding transcriptional regulator YafY
MPIIKSALNRYNVIDGCLNNKMKPFPSLQDLAIACSKKIRQGISESTIEKDLREMKKPYPLGYDAPIIYNKIKKGYCYAEEGFSISELQLEDKEWDGLRYAANLLHQYVDVPIFKNFKQAIEKINTRFNLLIDSEEKGFEKFVQFESGNATTGYHWIETIYDALRSRWKLTIQYENIYKKEIKQHTVVPGLLKEHRNKWYLIGWVEERKDYLTFALDRIHDITTTEIKQKHRLDFDADQFLKYSVGIMENDSKPQKVVLQIKAPYHKLIQLEPIHHSQRTISENKEFIKIEILVHVNHELCNHLLSMGSYCKVIQPASLKNQMIQSLRDTLKEYGG